MKIGETISKIRKDQNMTQEEFSKLFNVTRQTISSWENEKSYPDLQTLVDISNKFKVSLDVLLKGDETMVKSLNKKIKQSKIIKTILIVIGIIITLSIAAYSITYICWRNTEKKLITHYQEGLKEQGFQHKKKIGPWTLEEGDIIYTMGNWTELNRFDFDLYDGVDVEIKDQGIFMRIVDKDWIGIELSNISHIEVDKSGNIVKGKIADKDKALYEENKEKFKLMIKRGLEIYDSVYMEE